ncbi:hypothetical protein GCM10010399_13100 [Dactylosporangium fulvum]|uniref:Uncharacterized protein n=1 Tax=Dactylosporangium fulvum TaxID=53359 RepID=A0ABY5W5E8_9ACTN|nr:hypothetical protein [Dactylosporangium fulvum]UWP85267.1 hypothetical protein Dfulv_13955 [Dactylosporangium fulvum]
MALHRHRRWRGLIAARALAVCVTSGLATLSGTAVAAPAAAHPFGDPQTVAIAFDEQRPEVVHVRWRVGGPDDLTLLGVSLGLLPPDRVKPDGSVDYRYTDPAVLASSEQFAAYLLRQITVTDGGRPCAGELEPPRALDLKGAIADYACPGPIAVATVTVRMLTDLNPAYRTLATGPGGRRTVYEADKDTHDWTSVGAPAGDDAGLGRSAAVQIATVVGAVAIAVAAGFLVARRLHRRRTAA